MRKINSKLFFTPIIIILILIVTLLVLNLAFIITGTEEQSYVMVTLLSISIIVSLFIFGALVTLSYRIRLQRTNELISSLNSIESSPEEIFEVGLIIYDSEQTITYITPWLQRDGFEKFLGRNVSKLGIDIESNRTQNWKYSARKWNVIVSRKNNTILLKDNTYNTSLREMITAQQRAILSIHTSFSRKINFNDSVKVDSMLKINQALQEWANKIGGVLSSSLNLEGTVSVIFGWTNGEKDILSKNIMKKLEQSIIKNIKEITISYGVSYGNDDYGKLLEKSLKSLEISKNRGGGQIILEKPTGELEYIGVSSQQSLTSNILNIKKFHTEFISDVDKSREVLITSHELADLDSLGASLGIWQIVKNINKNVYIILNDFDITTLRIFNLLPEEIKSAFITEKHAKTLISNRTHYVIVDTSDPSITQAASLVENSLAEKISVIDHHRLNKESFQFEDSKTLIETSMSSASEIVTEMLKIVYGQDSQDQIEEQVSTALLAGIQLDSKQLSKNVTNSTFEAVSFLMSNNAKKDELENLFKPSQNIIKTEGIAFRNISNPIDGVIFTFINEKNIIDDELTSIIADKLLDYSNIKATFVLARVSQDKFKMSARSNGEINVQDIAEKLGGGGHFNSAAATWSSNIKFDTIKIRILDSILKSKK